MPTLPVEVMLVPEAHAPIVQSRLALSLAWVAGYVNTAAVLTCGVVTSHVTGHASNLGRDLAQRAWAEAAFMAALIAAFFVGALVSGFALEFGRLRGWSSIYVLPAAIELLLLSVFAVGVRLHDAASVEVGGTLWWMTLVAALAMGVQNATITRISSGVVRTTHLTGIVTDLGHETAQLAMAGRWSERGLRPGLGASRGPSARRLALLGSILGSFIFGSACGAWVYLEFPQWSMLAPVILLAWIIVADLQTPICERAEAEGGGSVAAVAASEAVDTAGMPEGTAVFHATARGGDGLGEAHLPDLAPLLGRAGPGRLNVVVDLTDVRGCGPLAANEMQAMLVAAQRTGHRMVFAGLTDDERASINASSRGDLLHDDNSAPTLAGALRIVARLASAR